MLRISSFTLALCGLIVSLSLPAAATVDVDFQTAAGCSVDVLYGAFPGFATQQAFVTAPGLGVLSAADVENDASNQIDLTCSLSGDGSSLLVITYGLQNLTGSEVGVSLFSQLLPEGSGSFFDAEVPSVVGSFPDGGLGPQAFAIGDVADDIGLDPASVQSQINDGALLGTNGCAVPCDVSMALQWDLTLPANGALLVEVGLSDAGEILSAYLTAARDATGSGQADLATVITFSGRVVPEPGTALLVLAGILGIARAGRSRRA